jgi:sec-independent protein translocase protein TatB
MFGMGAGELILILVLVLLIFGPKKLPDLAKGIGKALREFRRASTDLQAQVSGDNDLGDAMREVQAAASGMPSPAELQAARRARELETPPVPTDAVTPAAPLAEAREVAPKPAGDGPAATADAAAAPGAAVAADAAAAPETPAAADAAAPPAAAAPPKSVPTP